MTYLIHLHSILRWFILLGMFYTVFFSFSRLQNTSLKILDKKIYTFSMIFYHVQFLVGIILYIMSTKVVFSGEMMKNTLLRFYTMEHTIGMLLALAFITIGKKKADSSSKPYQKLAIYYTLALLITLLSIPWPFRNLGSSWW
jgi:hypothetical protein